MRYFFRFSLRTLLLTALIPGGVMLLYPKISPWILAYTIPRCPPEFGGNKNPDWRGQAILPDNKHVVLFNPGYPSFTCLWSLEKNVVVESWENCWQAAFCSQNPVRLLTTVGDKVVVIPSPLPPEVQPNLTLPMEKNSPHSITQSADGKYLINHYDSASVQTEQVFNVNTGRMLWISNHFITFAPDGKTIGELRTRSSIVIHETDTGKELRNIEWKIDDEPQSANSFDFSPDGKYLLVGHRMPGGLFLVFSAETGEKVAQWQGVFTREMPVFSPNSDCVVVRGEDHEPENVFEVRELRTGRRVSSFSARWHEPPRFSFDGTRLLLISSLENESSVRDPFSGEITHNFGKGPVIASSSAMYFVRDGREVWHRVRPEGWVGFAHLPEFWFTVVLTIVALCSFVLDLKRARGGVDKTHKAPQTV